MLGNHDEYLYDVTKPLQRIYNSYASYPVIVISAISTCINTIGMLVSFLSDEPDPRAAFICLAIGLISFYLAVQIVDYNDYYYDEKIAVYRLYLGLSRKDKKRYKKLMRKIHTVNHYGEFPVEMSRLRELFTHKQVDTGNGTSSYKDMVMSDLSNVREIVEIRKRAEKEVAKINGRAGL
jgi:hypothetical protein